MLHGLIADALEAKRLAVFMNGKESNSLCDCISQTVEGKRGVIGDYGIGRGLAGDQVGVDDEFLWLDAIQHNCVKTAANAHQASGGDVMC